MLAVLACVVGGILSYSIDHALLIRNAGDRLQEFSRRFNANGDDIDDEARAVLARMNHSPYPYCSSRELEYFRALIFESAIFKDGGHLHDGRIDCSALVASAEFDGLVLHPLVEEAGDFNVIQSAGPFHKSKALTFLVSSGNAFLSVSFPPDEVSLPAGIIAQRTARDIFGKLKGVLPGVPEWFFMTAGKRNYRGVVYGTQCSVKYDRCVTIIEPVRQIEQTNRYELISFAVLGGLLGLMAFLAGFFLYLRSRDLGRQLMRAIRNGEIQQVYQPIVRIGSGAIVGAEVLSRWTNEEGSSVSPEIFIPVAEAGGMIGELTQFVIRRALTDWQEVLRTRPGFRLSVNITSHDLIDAEFVTWLRELLQSFQVSPQQMILEITESATARRGAIVGSIRELRAAGFSIYIDDFGTGYSSLAYLHELDVDAIKIDRSFTQAVGTGAVTALVLAQILTMAESLQLAVSVEGIETREQESYFAVQSRQFCGQGWLYGRPMPVSELQARLNSE